MKNTVGKRIKEIRTRLGFTQSDLAKKVGMTYVQIGRYEARGAMPSSDALAKIADALNTTSDFLMQGATTDVAQEKIKDKELLNLFKEIDALSNKDKDTIKFVLDCIVTKRHVQQLAH
jgi:transcriptional regulator with XRE-family HTH domain